MEKYSNIINQGIVLQLNGNWQPVGQKSVRDAIIAMTSDGETPPMMAFDMSWDPDEYGQIDWKTPSYINPVKWDDWVLLPIRSYDETIHTANMTIRAPTVLIAPHYREMPMRNPTATRNNIRNRDAGVCQYTGKYVGKDGNLEHVIPKDRGGKNTWENLVWCDPAVNSKKGNKTPSEAGVRLLREPVAPKNVPASASIREIRHPSWHPFIKIKK